jgi:hypothetical protein
MDAELDTAPILAQTTVPILDEHTSIWEMGRRWSRRPSACSRRFSREARRRRRH